MNDDDDDDKKSVKTEEHLNTVGDFIPDDVERQISKTNKIIYEKRDKKKEDENTFILQYIFFQIITNMLEKILISVMAMTVYT